MTSTHLPPAVVDRSTRERDAASVDALRAELREWLAEHWDPELRLATWWERLGMAGWASPGLPVNAFGRGLTRTDALAFQRDITEFGAVGPPAGLGLLLAAPTIATHGTQAQIDEYVRDIVTGTKAWCQLFSEPGAGSDLAGLTTRAVRDGDEWVITGQKVWTSGGQFADLGMLLARTDPEVPKHQGISWFAIDMHQRGVEVRPLRELTGSALFNEVFLTEARVPVDALIGGLNHGWAVANTTLANERAGLGAGGGGAVSSALPGQVAGQLERRAGEFVGPSAPTNRRERGGPATLRLLIDLAHRTGRANDPVTRQRLVQLHVLGELGRLNGERMKSVRAAGQDIPGMANISKLLMSDIVRLQRDLGLDVIGASGMLHAYDDEQRTQLSTAGVDPVLGMVTTLALYAQAPPIYGGTDQIQRNIIGERALGLPKEPNSDKDTPFSALPKNT